jgi:hypothetical protein
MKNKSTASPYFLANTLVQETVEYVAYDFFTELDVTLERVAFIIDQLLTANEEPFEYFLYFSGRNANDSYMLVQDEIQAAINAFDIEVDLGRMYYA